MQLTFVSPVTETGIASCVPEKFFSGSPKLTTFETTPCGGTSAAMKYLLLAPLHITLPVCSLNGFFLNEPRLSRIISVPRRETVAMLRTSSFSFVSVRGSPRGQRSVQ